jgi:two-component system, NtrC family, nitrogen regulation sensor histidine kinase NtrY
LVCKNKLYYNQKLTDYRILSLKNIFKNKLFLITLASVLFLSAYFLHHSYTDSAASEIHNVENELHKKEQHLTEEMKALALRAETQSYNQMFTEKPAYYNELLEEQGLALLIYENDTLKFWSDNSIAVENWVKEVCLDTKMAKLHNGWFEVMRPPTNAKTTKTVVGLVLIKNEYPYQNKYLVNEFQKGFSVSSDAKLMIENATSKNAVTNISGDYLFSLEFNPANYYASVTSYFVVMMCLIACLLVVLFLKAMFFDHKHKMDRNYSILMYVGSIILLRYLSIKFTFPESFYGFELFSPKVFADAGSVWLTSLGDLL